MADLRSGEVERVNEAITELERWIARFGPLRIKVLDSTVRAVTHEADRLKRMKTDRTGPWKPLDRGGPGV